MQLMSITMVTHMENNYVAYHVHSDYSLLDSTTKFEDYVDYAISLEQKAIAFTEHGNIFNWVDKKMYCDKKGIKYIHGVEIYLTKTHDIKERDNYHTILLAKNYAGLKELNTLVSVSTEESHKYFKGRISFDEFLGISPNVIKISACLASPLARIDEDDEYYSKLARHYDYFEIQPHINSTDQMFYNLKLYELSKKYDKPLIAGTDTHNLSSYKAECRSLLQASKHIEYDNEDEFDLTYKTYDELVDMFSKQKSIPYEVFIEAINNTNIMADSVEEFELDTSFKYPILYGTAEKDEEVFLKTINDKLNYKINNGIIKEKHISDFNKNIAEECRVFKKIEMSGFMLFMSELITYCKENDIPIGFNRGSCGGSRVAYVTDITDLNPEEWNTVFSRFCNEDRKEIGD